MSSAGQAVAAAAEGASERCSWGHELAQPAARHGRAVSAPTDWLSARSQISPVVSVFAPPINGPRRL